MEVIGGAFSVYKSWWYLIEYFWRIGKWVANDDVTELDLAVNSSQGDRASLKQLQACEASKILGCGWHLMIIRTPYYENKK